MISIYLIYIYVYAELTDTQKNVDDNALHVHKISHRADVFHFPSNFCKLSSQKKNSDNDCTMYMVL